MGALSRGDGCRSTATTLWDIARLSLTEATTIGITRRPAMTPMAGLAQTTIAQSLMSAYVLASGKPTRWRNSCFGLGPVLLPLGALWKNWAQSWLFRVVRCDCPPRCVRWPCPRVRLARFGTTYSCSCPRPDVPGCPRLARRREPANPIRPWRRSARKAGGCLRGSAPRDSCRPAALRSSAAYRRALLGCWQRPKRSRSYRRPLSPWHRPRPAKAFSRRPPVSPIPFNSRPVPSRMPLRLRRINRLAARLCSRPGSQWDGSTG
jgi:hypothetical protein